MRILIAHNRYQQSGGEDNVVATETELLRSRGNTVQLLEVSNDHIQGLISRVTASFGSIYSLRGKHLMAEAIAAGRPDIVHLHNFFPTFSPAVFDACADAEVPVVHTLHNYRILCAAATLFRDGLVCEECIDKRSILPGIQHACYRSSRLGSAISGTGIALNDFIGTWKNKVSAYIALTEFAANKLGSFRIPRDKIFVKPNSAIDKGVGSGDGDYALFVGRLSVEKGIRTLLQADADGTLCMDVILLGDGPLRPEVERAASHPTSRLRIKGFVSREQTVDFMKHAKVLLFPSLWYEGLPLVLVEAFSMGLPIIAADLGNVASLIRPGETGMLYRADDAAALSAALLTYAESPIAAVQMRSSARAEYMLRYTPEADYKALMKIYEHTLSRVPQTHGRNG